MNRLRFVVSLACVGAVLMAGCSSGIDKVEPVPTHAVLPSPTPTDELESSRVLVEMQYPFSDLFVLGPGRKVEVRGVSDWRADDMTINYWPDSHGSVWLEHGHRESDFWIHGSVEEIDLRTGERKDWSDAFFLGKAANSAESGGLSTFTSNDQFVVWQARRQTYSLDFDDYDVYAARRDGSGITKVGESTPDYEGESFGVLGSLPALVITGDTVWWTESELHDPDGLTTMSIYSAPVDGSEPMRVRIEGAWDIEQDVCSSTSEQVVFTYLVSPMSSGILDEPSRLHRVVADTHGNIVTDDVVWESESADHVADHAQMCGDRVIVQVRHVADDSAELHVMAEGETTVVKSGFGFLMNGFKITPHGFFFQLEGKSYFYEFDTKQIYSFSGFIGSYLAEDDAAVILETDPDNGIRLVLYQF